MMSKIVRAALTAAFSALTDKQLGNLLFHKKSGRSLLCGKRANLFADGKGGG